MKKIVLILFLIIVTVSINAQSYLYISKNNIIIPSTEGKVKISVISNTTWFVTSSQLWSTILVELFYRTNGQNYISLPYSGRAPDLGAYEHLQTSAAGHDTAFLTFNIQANTGPTRISTIIVSGTNVTNQTITLTQEGTTPTVPYFVRNNGNLIKNTGNRVVNNK